MEGARPIFGCAQIFCIAVLILAVAATDYSRSLTDVLQNYQTLKKEHIKHSIKKRDVNYENAGNQHLHFRSFGRDFDLNLTPDHSIFSPDFKAVVVSDQEEHELQVEKDNFMKGYVKGEFNSRVQAHLQDGLLTANIRTKEDVFVVEPSSRHVNGKHDFDMIVYKLSDVKSNLTDAKSGSHRGHPSFCGVKDHLDEHREPYTEPFREESAKTLHRQRRATAIETYDTCTLTLVADHLFFKHMGQGQSSTAINYMLSVIQRVDNIYRSTKWPSGFLNIGLEVRKVIVHDSPSGPAGPEYNQYKSQSWSEEDLLTAFSKGSWRGVCLAHLFTYQDFPNGVIGVAYVGNSKIDGLGGICSDPFKNKDRVLTYLNSGLSSSLNWKRRILTSEADVVTSHEIGHNFGSTHDPFTTECSPSDSKGGKFMMHSTSVSGLKPNNQKFSPCSLRSIDAVLNAKRTRCFKSKIGQYCGNFEVERNIKDPSKSEQCDPGIDAILNGTDKCCDKNCKLKDGAQCSDANMPCCDNCKFANKFKKCRESFPLACQGETFCDGSSDVCPEAPPLSGVPCSFSKGLCLKGKCLTFCQQQNMHDCVCSKSDKVCKICCKRSNSTGAACAPVFVNGTEYNVNDGGPCDTGSFSGACLQGSCKKTQKNVFDHFLSLLNDFTASKFARFMQENIVGTILVFSLFVWIPGSCIVNYVDKRRERNELEKMKWQSIDNPNLLRSTSQDKAKGVFKNSPKRHKQSPQRKQARSPNSRVEVKDGHQFLA